MKNWTKGLLYLAFAVLAVFGNVISLPLFFGVDLLFGSIFVFLSLKYFGYFASIPISIAAAGYTYMLWNHPYAIIIFTLEYLLVGFFYRLKKLNFVILDVMYWILVGMPLVFVFYGPVMNLPGDSVVLIMLKQAINGIFNVTIVFVVVNLLPLVFNKGSIQNRTVSYTKLIFILMTLSLAIPTLFITAFMARKEFNKTLVMVSEELGTASLELEGSLLDWMQQKISAVQNIAQLTREDLNQPSESRQYRLKLAVGLNPDFNNMYIANSKGITIAFYPPKNYRGESTIGLDFSDRQYYKRLKEGAEIVISDVFLGRGGVFSPIVTISAPIKENETFKGFALAALNIDHLKNIISRVSVNRTVIVTILDSKQQIVASTDPNLKPMEQLDFEQEWDFGPVSQEILHGFRKSDRNSPQLNKWNNSRYFKKIDSMIASGWTIYAEIKLKPHITELNQFYISVLLFVFLFSAVSIGLSSITSKAVVKSIDTLQVASSGIANRVEKGETIIWPHSSIMEINMLISNYKSAADNLAVSFEALRNNQNLLEKRVKERTDDLSVAVKYLSKNMEHTKTIINTAQDAIISIDSQGAIELFNAAAERMFQYTAEEVEGKNVKIIVPPPHQENHDDYLKRYLETRKSGVIGTGREVLGKRKDGSQFPMRLAVGEMIYDGASYFVGVLTDITKQKEIEEDLIRSKEQSEEANRLKSEFLNTMSHELRTPLTVILGNIDELTELEELPEPDEIVDIAQDISNASRHLLRLINDLLDISKIEAGKMELAKDRINSADLIEDCIRTIKIMAENKKISLTAEGDHTELYIDPFRIKQVILNLLSNAIKFTDQGQVTVVTSISEKEFLIKIKDTGCGMDKESLKFIFDPFRQVDSSARRKIGGTGLGLAITQKLISMHRGAITVKSKLGEGSEFVIKLPLDNRDFTTVIAGKEV